TDNAKITRKRSKPDKYEHGNGLSVQEPGVSSKVPKLITPLVPKSIREEHQRASGLLQPLEIPVWKWDEISMDFVTGLPRTQRKHDAIWVVVDRLTKTAHFLPIRKDFSISRLAEMFQQEIVRLHGTPSAIVSDRDPRFTSRFWKGLQNAWGTRLKFSTAFHPETDGQSERTIQTLEDMLRSCALEWTGNWDDYICLVEFAYNNSWHASIKCAPFEMLYGRKCRAPICWDQVGERVLEGPEMIEVTNEKVAVAREKLKEAQTRQKSYADKHRRLLEFQPGEHVFLKVSPTRGVRRFGIKGKLSPRFIGPFEILERVGEVSYRLALPPQLSHVHNVFHVSLLRGYKYHHLHVVSYPFGQIREDLSYTEEPESILDRQVRLFTIGHPRSGIHDVETSTMKSLHECWLLLHVIREWPSSRQIVTMVVSEHFLHTKPQDRVKWLTLMENSFAVSRMVIAEPGVGATTRSAAHMDSHHDMSIVIRKIIKEVTKIIDVENWRIDNSRVLRWIVSLFKWYIFVSLMKFLDFRVRSDSGNGSTSSELEARVCIQGRICLG
ncbi:putative nucleotidyltransferase, ribonuclease H, partial [Tanacetum coccineum]